MDPLGPFQIRTKIISSPNLGSVFLLDPCLVFSMNANHLDETIFPVYWVPVSSIRKEDKVGHAVNPDKQYEKLQQYLDLTVTGAPASPTLMKILKLLFNEEEATFAVNLPLSPKSLGHISRKTGIELEKLDELVTRMAEKGLVIDLEYKNRRFVMLAPIIIGFFEFTFMRHREDAPMKELAELFEQYMKHENDLSHSVFQGQTQIGRSLVREEALPQGNYSKFSIGNGLEADRRCRPAFGRIVRLPPSPQSSWRCLRASDAYLPFDELRSRVVDQIGYLRENRHEGSS